MGNGAIAAGLAASLASEDETALVKHFAAMPEEERARLTKAMDSLGYSAGRRILIIFGPPGGGKGTYGEKIINKLGVPGLSTGDMLREAVAAGTELGLKAKSVMESGGFVDDAIIVSLITERIKQPDCAKGFMLDGFPRTVEQAGKLDEALGALGESVNMVLALEVPDDVLTVRICGRWVHKESGRSYHIKNKRPKSLPEGEKATEENMKDDETGEPLMRRADDTEETLGKRLKAYYEKTTPILDYWAKAGIVKKVEADDTKGKTMDDIWKSIEALL